ncbi:MAG: TSUP family transporter, partial [Chloroflexota bacterium]
MDAYPWVFLLLGFTAGTINNSVGLGWGVINMPILLMLPVLNARQAVALSVVTGIFAGAAATFENARHGLVQWHYVLFLGAGG